MPAGAVNGSPTATIPEVASATPEATSCLCDVPVIEITIHTLHVSRVDSGFSMDRRIMKRQGPDHRPLRDRDGRRRNHAYSRGEDGSGDTTTEASSDAVTVTSDQPDGTVAAYKEQTNEDSEDPVVDEPIEPPDLDPASFVIDRRRSQVLSFSPRDPARFQRRHPGRGRGDFPSCDLHGY